MAGFRLSSLLLLLLGAVGIAGLGENMQFNMVAPAAITDPAFAGGFWFHEVTGSTATTIADTDLQTAAKNGFESAKAAAPKVKKAQFPSRVKAPKVVAALFVPGKGVVVAGSISTGQEKQSTQTCKIVTFQHRNFANCAEPNAAAIAAAQGFIAQNPTTNALTIPPGTKMAIFGKPGKTQGFQQPCTTNNRGDGCSKFLADNPNIQLVNPASRRDVPIEFEA